MNSHKVTVALEAAPSGSPDHVVVFSDHHIGISLSESWVVLMEWNRSRGFPAHLVLNIESEHVDGCQVCDGIRKPLDAPPWLETDGEDAGGVPAWQTRGGYR